MKMDGRYERQDRLGRPAAREAITKTGHRTYRQHLQVGVNGTEVMIERKRLKFICDT